MRHQTTQQTHGVRPIEAQYRGIRFRTRLEARWAIFFDNLGTAWEYDPEGFVLPSGQYWPDFRLSCSLRYGPWVKVAPPYGEGPEDLRLLSELCEGTCMYGFLLSGPPGGMRAHHVHKEGGVVSDELDDFLGCLGVDRVSYQRAADCANAAHFLVYVDGGPRQ